MKYIYYLLLLLPLQSLSQVTLNWSDTLVVNRFNTNAYTRPKITLTSTNAPVIMWGQHPNQRVFVSRQVGNEFAPASIITPTNMNAFVQDWAGPDMASFGDTIYVVFKSQPETEGFVYSVISVDGGVTFSDTTRVYPSNFSRFPAVAVAPGGKPYVTFMTFNSNWGNAEYVVATSEDGGETFGTEVEASNLAPGSVCDCCPGFIGTEANDYVYSLFRNNDNNLRDIWAAISTNGGENFNTAGDLDNSNWIINGCPSTGPDAYINGDSIVTVWMSGASGFARIYLGTAHKNSLNIGINEMITPSTLYNQNYPKVAGNGDTLGIAWQENQMGNIIIKFVYSVNGPAGIIGQTPETVNLNFEGASQNPDVTYSNGTFYFVWQDDNKKTVTFRTASISGPTGLDKSPRTKPFTVFPNPAIDQINISFQDEIHFRHARISIVDISGNVLFSKAMNSLVEVIPTSNLPAGLYLLQVAGDSYFYKEKITIIK